jgi:hypothetical protein
MAYLCRKEEIMTKKRGGFTTYSDDGVTKEPKKAEESNRLYSSTLTLGFSSFWIWLLLGRGTLVNIKGLSISDLPYNLSLVSMLFIFALLGLVLTRKVDTAWLTMKNVLIVLVALAAVMSSLSYSFTNLVLPVAILFSILRPGLFVIWFAWLISNSRAKLVEALILSAFSIAISILLLLCIPQSAQLVLVHLYILLSGILLIPMKKLRLSSDAEEELAPSFKMRDLILFVLVRILLGATNWLFFQLVSTPYVITDALTYPQQFIAASACLGAVVGWVFVLNRRLTPPPPPHHLRHICRASVVGACSPDYSRAYQTVGLFDYLFLFYVFYIEHTFILEHRSIQHEYSNYAYSRAALHVHRNYAYRRRRFLAVS